MIINIFDLLERKEKEIVIDKTIPNFVSEISCNQPIEIKGSIRIENRSLKVNLLIKLQYNMVCSRCIEEFVYLSEFEINEDYDIDKNQGMLEDDILDLTELIRENILLHIPIKALCNESCKGLCAVCGTNNNVQHCNCNHDHLDPRLSVLNNILNGDE